MDIKSRFNDYVGRLTKEDRIAVYTGPDVDGISSAYITSEAVRRVRNKPVDLFLYEETNRPGLSQSNKLRLDSHQINKLIVLDISIDNAPQETINVLKSLDTLVLDHHITLRDLNKEGIVFVKPEYFSDIESARYPSSKMSYDLFSEHTNLKDIDWVCSLGVMSDSSYLEWKGFVDDVAKKYDISLNDDIWKSDLGKIVTVLNRALLYDIHNASECLDALRKSGYPKELLQSSIVKYKKEVDGEINKLESKFLERSEKYHEGNTILYEFTSRFGVCSTLSTILSYRHMSCSCNLVVIQSMGDKCIINLRRNDKKVNLASIVKGAVEGLQDSSGGGHIPAAGAEIRKKDLPKFKKNLLKLLE